MKKSVIFLVILVIIILSIIANRNFIYNSKENLKGFLKTSKPQNISLSVLPAIPILKIISPENITYSTFTVLLNYTVKNPVDAIWYVLDDSEGITIISPIFFYATEGSHVLYLYANNSQGTSFKSVTFSVKITTQPPSDGGGGGGAGSGGGGGGDETEPTKEDITKFPEIPQNITKPEIPKNITKPLEGKTEITKKTTIKFLIILLFLILLAFIILIFLFRKKKKTKRIKQRKS